MQDDRQHEHPFGNGENCPECEDLRGLFASVDPGPPPAELRRSIRAAVADEPAPSRRIAPSTARVAGLAAAAICVGMLLAPFLGEKRSPAPVRPEAVASAAAVPASDGEPVDVQVRRTGEEILLEWRDGRGDYLVERSPRPDRWDEAERVLVAGENWRDAEAGTANRLTFYRVRPTGEILR